MIPSTTVAAVNNEIPHLLLTYAELTPTDAAALVRSSTLYQDALWYSDIMPDLSWLMLVQSVETLAQAAKTDCDDYEWIWEADGRKSLKLFLSDRGMSADDIAHVATILAPDCGATRNFRSFMLEHFATEPSIRPCRAMQVEWSTSRWRIILNGLYGLRSKAVHEGRRFPDELCIPPGEDQKGVYAEYPPPYNGTPKSVHLHVFSDFTRQVLLNWWRSKSSDDQIVVLKGC